MKKYKKYIVIAVLYTIAAVLFSVHNFWVHGWFLYDAQPVPLPSYHFLGITWGAILTGIAALVLIRDDKMIFFSIGLVILIIVFNSVSSLFVYYLDDHLKLFYRIGFDTLSDFPKFLESFSDHPNMPPINWVIKYFLA